jgi:hypothetical protein
MRNTDQRVDRAKYAANFDRIFAKPRLEDVPDDVLMGVGEFLFERAEAMRKTKKPLARGGVVMATGAGLVRYTPTREE